MDIGTVLLGKYRIDDLLGIGGMGRVVKATHLYLNQPVAIKILLPEMAENAARERFLREAQATVRLRSEHIARVMDVATLHDGTPLMVMEYLEGNDLNQILRHHGPQAPTIVVDLILQACEGISEAHANGIIHRDIKPSNFFITRRPDGSMLLKILDFGISKTPIGYTELTGTESVIGTPTYMAPEQMKNSRDIDPRCDIWSIGVVMYQLLNGRPPFAGEGYAELVLKVAAEPPQPMHVPLPPGLADVILKCLEKDPNRRHQNVGELARMLAPYASDPISAAASAARAVRILQPRSAQPHALAIGMGLGGGYATPTPMTPPAWQQQTNPTSVSGGVGQQLTHVTHSSKRAWLIAGVATLCVLAGAGGFIASRYMKDDAPVAAANETPPPPTTATGTNADAVGTKPAEATGSAAAATASTPTPTIPAAPTTPDTTAKPDDKSAKPADTTAAKTDVKTATKTDDKTAKSDKTATKIDVKTDTKIAAKTDDKTAATTAAKSEPKTATKPVAKTDSKSTKSRPKPTPKTTKPKPSGGGGDDLFDTRK